MATERTLVVFGASGQVGEEVVAAALRAGWRVRAFTRDAARIEPRPGLLIVEGDALDADQVSAAIQGVDAVVNALGPTTNQRAEVERTLTAIRHIIAAMDHHGGRRLVSLNGAAVDVMGDRKPLGARMASWIVRRVAGNVVRAKQREADEIVASALDWTIVRPPRIRAGAPAGRVVPGDRLHSRTVDASDLATFMVEELDRRDYVRQAPFVSG